MRILRAIIQAFVRAMLDIRHDLPSRGAVGAQLVRNHALWCHALPLQQSSQQALGSLGATAGLDYFVKNAAMLIDGPPQPMLLAGARTFIGATSLFYLSIASLVVPSIIISLGIGVTFQQTGLRPSWYTSAFGAHPAWTLPSAVLIMFAVFNRFSPSYDEAARNLGATSCQTFRHVVLPMIAPMLIGVGLFGFTLSYDKLARTLMTVGACNALPLEIYGMTTNVTTPVLYALGTVTTPFSFLVILLTLAAIVWIGRRRLRRRDAA